MQSLLAVLAVPAVPAQVALYVPRRLGMVVNHAQLAIADRAKVHFLVMVGVLLVKACLAQQSPGLHFPLPFWLVAVLLDLFAAHRANVRRFLLLEHELPCLFDVAVATEHAFNPPLFAGFVFVAPKLLAAYCAIDWILFAENVQAKLLACTVTKMYVGANCGVRFQYYVMW